ncbi:M1 family metallopeptidase [bacterium]|nr:M1 family metallopeptidase [bacterium]
MTRPDPHSCWIPEDGTIKHIHFHLTADFKRRIFFGFAIYDFDKPLSDTLSLDTRKLNIKSVASTDSPEQKYEWKLEDETSLGQTLTISGVRGLRALTIHFSTSPDSDALQWLDPEQTAGKQHPYVLSQCQAILARSVFPCQDSPGVRFTYDVELTVPKGFKAVMGSESLGSEETEQGTLWRFHMKHAIPSYLFALAIGNIASEKIGKKTWIYAEPEILKDAAWEFTGVDRMLECAEAIFGEYVWDRFDLLVMPPSFPYGGMENPTLTFLTPTVIAGDRSLVNVVTHELAHSWTGNLVTNATWEDFWLNEGWTVWAERRILERLEGEESAHLYSVNGRHALDEAIADFGKDSPLTRLKTDLKGHDPDDVYSQIPYEKGYLFLVAVERAVGRNKFDDFVKKYIDRFKFQSLTTDAFLQFLKKELPEAFDKVDVETWVHGTGLPADVPAFQSKLIDDVMDVVRKWKAGQRDIKQAVKSWDVTQKRLFLNELPLKLSHEEISTLDKLFNLADSRNSELKVPWLCMAAASSYKPAYGIIREFLGEVGRGKFLKPLYKALHENPDTKKLAAQIFDEVKDGYHHLSRVAIERILEE